jgi:RNA polymerase sigma-70 factor (ECF subfamily)
MSDAEAVIRARNGHPEAFAEVVRRWAGRITAICHSKTRRADAADDLTQETFLRGFRALHTLSDPERVGAWLMGIAVRACLDWLKAKERSTISFGVLEANFNDHSIADPGTPDHATDRNDSVQELMKEVEALPEPLRQVIMLYYYDDLTYRELGELLGVSTATINARLTKARNLLRERLAPSPTG